MSLVQLPDLMCAMSWGWQICSCYAMADASGWSMQSEVAKLPPKTWGPSARGHSFLEQRRHAIQAYLQQMLVTPRGLRNPFLLVSSLLALSAPAFAMVTTSLCLCGRSSLGSTPRRRPRQAPRENPLARARSMGRLRSRASSIGSWSRSRSRRQCRARGSPRPPARLACPPREMRPARSPKLPAPPPHRPLRRPPSPKRLRRTCLAMTTVATGMRRKGVGCLTRPSRSQRLRPRRRRPQRPRAKRTMVDCLATLRRMLTRVKQTGGCSTTTVASLTRRPRRRLRLRRRRLRLRKAATVAVCSRTMGGCSMRRPSRLRPKRRRPKPRRRSCHGPSRPTVRKLPNLASRLSWLTARCRLRLLAHRAEKACAGCARAHEAAQGGRSCGSC